jgi:hypothetical protein
MVVYIDRRGEDGTSESKRADRGGENDAGDGFPVAYKARMEFLLSFWVFR